MWLTAEEIEYMTGFKRPSDQIEWLKKNKVRYAIARQKKPRVLQSHVEEIFGANKKTKPINDFNYEAANY